MIKMLPQRVVLTIMGFLGVAIVIGMRACFSIVLTEMVMPMENTEHMNTSAICSANEPSFAEISFYNTGTKFNWAQAHQRWTLSSYYAGYAIGHIPAAFLVQKFSAKWMLSLSVLVSCICSAAVPVALTCDRLDALIAVRIFMELFSGIVFSAVATLLSSWVPSKERATLGSIVFGGGQFGHIFAFYTTDLQLTSHTWPEVFYFCSVFALVWLICFTLFCYKDPASHPFISSKERDYLRSEIRHLKRNSELPPIPWRQIMASTPVRAVLVSQIGYDGLYTTLFTYLPKYMKEVLGFTAHEIGTYTSISSLSTWIGSIAFGFLCDYLINKCYLKTVHARKIFTAFSGLVPPILLVIISNAECNRTAFITLIILAAIFRAAYFPGMRVNILDLAPNYAGALMAYINGVGCIGSIIFSGIAGIILTNSTIEQWRLVFKILLAFSLVRVAVYSIWSSAKIQPWNNPLRHDPLESHQLTSTMTNETQADALN